MAQDRKPAEDPLARKAADVERLREFVDETSFSGDEREIADELTISDQHPADHSDVTEQRARDYAIKQMLEQEAEQIREAMRRREEGTYGICENCGRPISPERLEARPEATLCIDCARAMQHPA
jgi:RNA polymerase-binding transcription factor DksA